MDTSKVTRHGLALACLLLSMGLANVAQADALGVYIGVGSWRHSSEGHLNHLGTKTDMQKDLGYEDDFSGFFYLAFEHPFPLIPNIRLSHYGLESKGNKTVTTSSEFTFAGASYTNGDSITTELRWDEEDTLVYYELLDIVVSFDVGLGVKTIAGEFSVTSAAVTNTLKIDETLPIAYAMVAVMIPGTGISISIDKTQTFLGDAEIVQTNSKISYETAFRLGVEVGYRSSSVNLDKYTDIDGQLTFTGPFVNLLVHF